MLNQIETKLKEIATQLEQSIAHHNFLLGAKASLEAVANTIKEAAPVVEALDPALTPVIDTVEAVAAAVE